MKNTESISQWCCGCFQIFKLYSGEYKRLRKVVLWLATFDTIFILTTIVFTGISLAAVNKKFHALEQRIVVNTEENEVNAFSTTESFSEDENFVPLPSPVTTIPDKGILIMAYILMVIYISQLFLAFLLILGIVKQIPKHCHTWLIVTTVFTLISLLFYILNFFGNYLISSAIVTGLYILFKLLMMKLVYNFKMETHLQILHFRRSQADFEPDSD